MIFPSLQNNNWYEQVKDYTLRLVAIRSVSPGEGENRVAEEVLRLLCDDWLYGRGVADMKSGVAVNIAVMRRLAEHSRASQLPLSILLLATPDEENESAGVLQAARFLQRLQAQYQLDFRSAINTDYTMSGNAGPQSWTNENAVCTLFVACGQVVV